MSAFFGKATSGGSRVGALDDPDRGAERDQRLDVLGGAVADTPESRSPMRAVFARACAIQLEGRIDVRRALHVDPQEVAALLGPLDQPIEVALAQRAIEIEPELRRLDGDLRVEPGRRDLVQHVEVVLRDFLGFLPPSSGSRQGGSGWS